MGMDGMALFSVHGDAFALCFIWEYNLAMFFSIFDSLQYLRTFDLYINYLFC